MIIAMKQNRVTIWLLVATTVLLLLQYQQVFVESAAIEASSAEQSDSHEQHNHNIHDDHPLEEEHSEVTLKTHGEDCQSEGVKCNDKEGLICFEDTGTCDCNRHLGMVFSSEHGKCEEVTMPMPKSLPEGNDDENSLDEDSEDDYEDEDEATTTKTPEAVEELHSVVHEDEVSHDGKENEKERHHEIHSDPETVSKCTNVDCHSDLGKYSSCDESTGECFCNDTENMGRPVKKINGTCWIVRKINDACRSHEDCLATIKGNAWCYMDLQTYARFCKCEMYNYFDEELQECLQLATDGLQSPCKSDYQCRGFKTPQIGHGMGPNAICSKETGLCECSLDKNQEKGFYYENYCYLPLTMGDTCNNDRECEMALADQDVVCSENKTCACRNSEEEYCPKSSSESADGRSMDDGVISSLKASMGIELSNSAFLMIIGGVVLLTVVVIFVVFMIRRRRRRYSAVRTSDPRH